MKFIGDRKGVAEEFTSLPALIIVMIGFALFFAMFANVYMAHNEKLKTAELAEAAHYIALKLTNAESPLTDAPLLINKEKWEYMVKHEENIRKYCKPSSYNYSIKISSPFVSDFKMIGEKAKGDRMSVSMKVAIKLAEGDVKYGKLIVTVWRENE
ncbi:MAG: hypothetical protein J7K47_02475 [Thermoplasmata archaeon]|nr:hypothetical protein [Thermoplasmata archaeon]